MPAVALTEDGARDEFGLDGTLICQSLAATPAAADAVAEALRVVVDSGDTVNA
jgi:hypothetical protein